MTPLPRRNPRAPGSHGPSRRGSHTSGDEGDHGDDGDDEGDEGGDKGEGGDKRAEVWGHKGGAEVSNNSRRRLNNSRRYQIVLGRIKQFTEGVK